MIATLERMSRPKTPPTENVRIESTLAKQARMVAADLDMSVPKLLSDLLRGPLGERYEALRQKMVKESAAQKRSAAG